MSQPKTNIGNAGSSNADNRLLRRALAGSLAAGGVFGLLRSYLSYVSASFDEDRKLGKSVRNLDIPLPKNEVRERKPKKRRFDVSMFERPPVESSTSEDEGRREDTFSDRQGKEDAGVARENYVPEEDTTEKESPQQDGPAWLFPSPEEHRKAASEGLSIGAPSIPAMAVAPALMYGGFTGASWLTEKLMSAMKKAEVRRQLLEAEAAYQRALEAENKQMGKQASVGGAPVNSWTYGNLLAMLLAGSPLLVGAVAAHATDKTLSAAYPPLNRKLPTSLRVRRVPLPGDAVLDEEGEPYDEPQLKSASAFVEDSDAIEAVWRVVKHFPDADWLGDMVKAAALGGLPTMEKAFCDTGDPEAVHKTAAAFSDQELDAVTEAAALRLLTKSATVWPIMEMSVASVVIDHMPGMVKAAAVAEMTSPGYREKAVGALAALGAAARLAALGDAIPGDAGSFDKAASVADERELIEKFLDCRLSAG